MVATSFDATASRKPKSRDSRVAPSCSCSDRSAQMRLNTVAEAVSSSPTVWLASPVITLNSAAATTSRLAPNSPA